MTMRGVKQLLFALIIVILAVIWLTGCAVGGPLGQIVTQPGESIEFKYKRDGIKYEFECSGSGTINLSEPIDINVRP